MTIFQTTFVDEGDHVSTIWRGDEELFSLSWPLSITDEAHATLGSVIEALTEYLEAGGPIEGVQALFSTKH